MFMFLYMYFMCVYIHLLCRLLGFCAFYMVVTEILYHVNDYKHSSL